MNLQDQILTYPWA